MKRSYFIPIMLILVLSLYSAQNLSASYGSATIPAQPNMSKDFAISNYEYEYNTSSYSITSFSETLEDDVFYTPDGFYDDTIVLASEGGGEATNNDWADSLHVDGYRWTIFSGLGLEYASFAGDYNIEGFDFAIYGLALGGGGGGGNISIKDASTSEWIALLDTTNTTEQWYNGTYFGPISDYYPPRIYLVAEGYGGGAISIDYMEIRFYYLPLIKPDGDAGIGLQEHYGNSFTNISGFGWDTTYNESGDSFATDGDVFTIGANWDGGTDLDLLVLNNISVPFHQGYVIEIRLKVSSTTGDWTLQLEESDHVDGSWQDRWYHSLPETTSWSTIKYHFDEMTQFGTPEGDIEALSFYCRTYSTSIDFEIDYIRIGPSYEMGFQRDCSKIDDVTVVSGGTLSTDGDRFTFSGTDALYDEVQFKIDSTTTEADLKIADYPFLRVRWVAPTTQECQIQVYDENGAGYAYSLTETGSWVTTTINVDALVTAGSYVSRIDFHDGKDNSQSFQIDYIKLYGIANFTITQSGAGLDTILYVDTPTGELVYDSGTDPGNVVLFHDPELDVDRAVYPYWNISSTTGLNTTGANDFNFYDEDGYQNIDITNGTWQGETGTFEDFHLTYYTATTIRIENIVFRGIVPDWRVVDTQDITFVLPAWNIVGTVIIYFFTPIGDALNIWYILLGLIMLPCSTLFLVHGGREKLSMDKAFFFIVLFMLGWALIIGGIF